MTPTVGGDVGAARCTRGRGPRSDKDVVEVTKWPVQLYGEPATDDRTLTDIKDQAFKVTSFT